MNLDLGRIAAIVLVISGIVAAFDHHEEQSIIGNNIHFEVAQVTTKSKGKNYQYTDVNHGHPGIYLRFKLHDNGQWTSRIGHPSDPHEHHWIGGTWTQNGEDSWLLTPDYAPAVKQALEYLLNHSYGHGPTAVQSVEHALFQLSLKKGTAVLKGKVYGHGRVLPVPDGIEPYDNYVKVRQRVTAKGWVDW